MTIDQLNHFMSQNNWRPAQTKAEIKELPSLLQPEEELKGLLEGMLKRIHGRDVNGVGLVIATSHRVIFFRKSFIGTVTKEEIPLSKVSSVSFRKGILTSSVNVVTSNNEAEVIHCNTVYAQKFSETLNKLLVDEVSNTNSNIPNITLSTADQLEKLFNLKEKGILTDEEFLQEKAKLLGSK